MDHRHAACCPVTSIQKAQNLRMDRSETSPIGVDSCCEGKSAEAVCVTAGTWLLRPPFPPPRLEAPPHPNQLLQRLRRPFPLLRLETPLHANLLPWPLHPLYPRPHPASPQRPKRPHRPLHPVFQPFPRMPLAG